MDLIVNRVYAKTSGQLIRLIYLDNDREIAAFMPLDMKAFPEVCRVSEAQRALVSKQIIAVADPFEFINAGALKRSNALARRNRNMTLVEEMQRHAPKLFFRGQRMEVLRCVAAAEGVSHQALVALLRRWWIRGQVPNAVLPAFDKCGFGKAKTGTVRKAPGAKPFLSERDIYPLTDSDRKVMHLCIRRYYLRNKKYSLPKVHDVMLYRFYSLPDDDGVLVPLPEGKRPSLRQLTYYLRIQFDCGKVRIARKGATQIALTERPTLSSAVQDCYGPGHYFEIDATLDNTHLVSRDNRAKNIGRPTVYLIRDRWSRYIPAFHVTLDAPSWMGAISTLVAIAEDKEDHCKRHGIRYDPSEWPAAGYPKLLVVDRAEGISFASDSLIRELGIDVASLPPFRGDLKGVVENGLRLVQVVIKADTPGYKVPALTARGPKNNDERTAALTLDEYISLIARTVHRLNMSRIGGYPLTPAMVADGVRPIPLEILRWGIKNRGGRLRHLSATHVLTSLLPRATARVTGSGIEYGKCFYTFKKAVEESWYLRAARTPRDITISYDRRCVDRVYWRDTAADGELHILVLTPKSQANYAGWSFAEVAANEHRLRQLDKAAEHESKNQAVIYQQKNSSIFHNAKAHAKNAAGPNPPKNQRTRDQKQTRAAAQLEERVADAERLAEVAVPQRNVATVVPLRREPPGRDNTLTKHAEPLESVVQRNLRRLIDGEY
jgi:putative transposase